MSWLLSSICFLKTAVEAFVRPCITWDVPPKSWVLPLFAIPTPEPWSGEEALTKGSEKVDAAFVRLANSEVGMP